MEWSSKSQVAAMLVGVITGALIALKLFGYITWSWWWVLTPVWLAAGAVTLLALFILVIAVISGWYK